MIQIERILHGLESYIKRYISALAAASAAGISPVGDDEDALANLLIIYKILKAIQKFPLPLGRPKVFPLGNKSKTIYHIASSRNFLGRWDRPSVSRLYKAGILGDIIQISKWWHENVLPVAKGGSWAFKICLIYIESVEREPVDQFYLRIASTHAYGFAVNLFFQPLHIPVISKELVPVKLRDGIAFVDEEKILKILKERGENA